MTTTAAWILIALLSGPAMAGRNADGAMLLHVDNTVNYSAGADYCTLDPLPATCAELVTNITRDPSLDTMIWMVGAFASGSSPGVNAFQVGLGGDVTMDYFDASAVCGWGALEIPDPNWPGAGAGDAVAYTSTVYDHLFKMYWFAAGAPGVGSTLSTTNYYGGDHHAEWADDSTPPVIDYCDLFGTVAWGGPGTRNCPDSEPYGACCFADGHCLLLRQSTCQQEGGSYQGDATACNPNPCPQPTGACCFHDGHCAVATQSACASQGGTWQGMNTSCDPNPCPQPTGACCFHDGHCAVATQSACASQGGTWRGMDTVCDPNPCPPLTGACCFIDGHCSLLTRADCDGQGGAYQGDDVACDASLCSHTGACCFRDGRCTLETVSACGADGGTWQGIDTVCDPNPCPQPTGACCFHDGHCAVATQSACASQGGTWRGMDTVCDPNPCPQPTGACCFRDGSCALETESACASQGGTWHGMDTVCNPNPCPEPTGACCNGSACTVLTPLQCQAQGGTYIGDDVGCDPSPCCSSGPRHRPKNGARPSLFVRGSGSRNVVRSGRDVCWSEPADLNGLIASSEQILAFGLECEIANDFVPTGDITHVTFWGGYYNNNTPCAAGVATCGLNLKFYADAGCVPSDPPYAWVVARTFGETSVGCQAGVYPMFQWDIDVNVNATSGNLYWFGGQIQDHPFPPQGGRLAAAAITGCESMFKSEYFGYPNWTPAVDVFGIQFDASQEFTCTGGGTPSGACCFPDGHCLVLMQPVCQQQGGSYQGDATACNPNPCPQPTGACCFHDGHCAVATQSVCASQGGTWQGMNASCDPNPCPQPTGACCFHDGHCTVATQSACTSQGGTWQGMDTICNPNPCPPLTGACCFIDGHCSLLTRADCDGQEGAYQGDDVACDASLCSHTGACCFHDGHCAILTASRCQEEAGSYMADGLSCDPNPCPQPTGACCFHDGRCTVETQSACGSDGGTWQGMDTGCDPNPCPQPSGACCFPDGHCTSTTQSACTSQGGTWQGVDTACNPNPCQQPPGACCFADQSCRDLTSTACVAAGGFWQGYGTDCATTECPMAGACCFPDGSCSLLMQVQCDQECGIYQGDGTSCDPNPCPPRRVEARAVTRATLKSNPFERSGGSSPLRPGRNVGGAMVLHVDSAVCYSNGVDYCSDNPLPTTCEELVTDIARNPSVPTIIWIVAAFPPNSSPGVVAFQVGIYGDVPLDHFEDWSPCGAGTLEIPDATWPAPGTGTACAFMGPVYSRLFKLYWFAAGAPGIGSSLRTGAYPSWDHHAEWADDSNPPVIDICNLFGNVVWGGAGGNECPGPVTIGACCFPDGSCQIMSQEDCGAAGGVWQGVGTECLGCPQPMGACCLSDGSCRDLSQADCAAAGGVWQGPGTACASWTCPPPTGACCFQDGSCQNLTQDQCAAQGGTFHSVGTSCDTFTCPPPAPTGACCIGDVCMIETQQDCSEMGGYYQGDGTTCSPTNPCLAIPVKLTTWGRIKSLYR